MYRYIDTWMSYIYIIYILHHRERRKDAATFSLGGASRVVSRLLPVARQVLLPSPTDGIEIDVAAALFPVAAVLRLFLD